MTGRLRFIRVNYYATSVKSKQFNMYRLQPTSIQGGVGRVHEIGNRHLREMRDVDIDVPLVGTSTDLLTSPISYRRSC
jgi:hypothetical protein